ncbi:hypothetical protein [Agaribacterium haliotis]|uniref:hypothetical protein n=1 Tax=Agaribacterium haliotis TaxID=2013869 RepID=UPI001178804D|nr:hypothetical protein [Agaribacterium haliotis]
MTVWLAHFDELASLVNQFEQSALSAEPGVVHKEVDTRISDAYLPASKLETELRSGLELPLWALDRRGAFWSYKNQPVFVFAVDVAELDDGDLRTQFYHQVHLGPCCEALSDQSRYVHIASCQSALKKWPSELSFELCHHCLFESNYRGYRALNQNQQAQLQEQFNFLDFVRWRSADYFPEQSFKLWHQGRELCDFDTGGNVDACVCVHCQWPLEADSAYFVNDAAALLGLEQPCCLCCTDKAEPVAIVRDSTLIEAYARRYADWKATYKQVNNIDAATTEWLKFSWGQIAFHFPPSWQPLLDTFKQFEPADIYCDIGGAQALLAWPRMKRAIISDQQQKDAFPETWELWTFSEVLQDL